MKIQYINIIILNILVMIILSILFDYSTIIECIHSMILCIILLIASLLFISLIKSIIELIMYIKSNHED